MVDLHGELMLFLRESYDTSPIFKFEVLISKFDNYNKTRGIYNMEALIIKMANGGYKKESMGHLL